MGYLYPADSPPVSAEEKRFAIVRNCVGVVHDPNSDSDAVSPKAKLARARRDVDECDMSRNRARSHVSLSALARWKVVSTVEQKARAFVYRPGLKICIQVFPYF